MKITYEHYSYITLKIHVNGLEKFIEFFNLLNITEFLIVPTEYYNLACLDHCVLGLLVDLLLV